MTDRFHFTPARGNGNQPGQRNKGILPASNSIVRFRCCQWIDGSPTGSWTWSDLKCGAETILASAYCEAHEARSRSPRGTRKTDDELATPTAEATDHDDAADEPAIFTDDDDADDGSAVRVAVGD